MSTSRNIILRRLAALLAFALLVTAFAALFYLKIIPDNRAYVNQRGHKALTQQVQNFLRKDQDLHNNIENARSHFPDLVGKKPLYDRLAANMHYDTSVKLPRDYPHHLWKTDSADTAGTGELNPTGLSLLYQKLPLSASAYLNADTTKTLALNSDRRQITQ
jgi:hypothetical protein